MMDKKKNGRKPTRPADRDRKQADVPTYPLETIMALQKALEGGITPEKTPAKTKSRYGSKRAIARQTQTGLIARIGQSLAEMGRELEAILRSAMGFKKRSRQTSAP